MHRMNIRHRITVLDAADIAAESAFWASVLGGDVDGDSDWHAIMVEGKPALAIQLAPDHQAPQWPDGLPQQMHLDLWVTDPDDAHREVMQLGARLLQDAGGSGEPDDFRVYSDLAGHPFCICWWNN
jgi:hypothetical protein